MSLHHAKNAAWNRSSASIRAMASSEEPPGTRTPKRSTDTLDYICIFQEYVLPNHPLFLNRRQHLSLLQLRLQEYFAPVTQVADSLYVLLFSLFCALPLSDGCCLRGVVRAIFRRRNSYFVQSTGSSINVRTWYAVVLRRFCKNRSISKFTVVNLRLPYRYSRYCTCRTNTDVTFGG